MVKNLLAALIVIIPVALITGVIVSARIEQIAEPTKIQNRGLVNVRKEDGTGFGMIAFAFGVAASLVYLWAQSRWPELAPNVFLGLGLGLAVLLSVAAAIVRPAAGLRGVPEVIALNLLWGTGYGWAMPLAVRLIG